MKLLAADFAESLHRGEPRIEALRTVGDPDPGAAAAAFSLALEEPSLAPHAETWVPALLRSARPGRGAERLLAIARAHRKAGGMFDLRRAPSLPLVLGSSDFLARLLVRHPDWVEELETPLSEPTRIEPIAPDWDAIRDAKYRGLLRIAAGDLSNRPFRESLRALSNLADACLISAMQCTARELCAPDPPMLFALGKLGGDELNFSSDVDLLFLYDASAGGDNLERNQRAANFIRHLKKRMELPTEKGFIYRVDLDLRPEGVAGALANSVSAALDYYERFGAEWERQMLIRLRLVTGPDALANAFCEGIRPFVYRRSIDPAVLRAVRDMKHRIETERREARRDLEVDLKEGPGGIRDVEFFVQAFQLFLGGRTPEIRTGNTLDGLEALGRLEMLPEDTVTELSTAYLWLRRAEHAQQLVEEQQTSKFPRYPGDQLGLARRMGYDEASGDDARARLIGDWNQHRAHVRAHFDALVLSGDL
jgi:glutamate-ammonia-ligase adenylyltransferase